MATFLPQEGKLTQSLLTTKHSVDRWKKVQLAIIMLSWAALATSYVEGWKDAIYTKRYRTGRRAVSLLYTWCSLWVNYCSFVYTLTWAIIWFLVKCNIKEVFSVNILGTHCNFQAPKYLCMELPPSPFFKNLFLGGQPLTAPTPGKLLNFFFLHSSWCKCLPLNLSICK